MDPAYHQIGPALCMTYFVAVLAWFPIRYALGWVNHFLRGGG